MIWVQRIIWVVLALFSASVLYVVFSGGFVDDEAADERDRRDAEEKGLIRPPQGEMAYDRFLPGGRQGDPPAGASETGP